MPPERKPGVSRRTVLQGAGGGMLAALVAGCQGGNGAVNSAESRKARAEKLADGRQRLPPGQYVLNEIRQMGGAPGDADYHTYRLKVYGEVEEPIELDYAELLKLPHTEQTCDIHCVTRWSLLDSKWGGVRVAELAQRVKVKPTAKHVIFEAAHGYTSNVPLDEALEPTVLVAHHFGGDPLAHDHGGPVRALVPSLYFWKSAKWLTAVRFSAVDEPGFWEVRGYHNHGNPWLEERYG